MRRDEMHETLARELEHIPRGGYEQNLLRAMYSMERQHALVSQPDAPAEVSLGVSIEDVRRTSPQFEPAYDRSFFALTR